MGKIKVSELANKMELSNTEMVEKLKSSGIDVKTASSSVEESLVQNMIDSKDVKPVAKKPVENKEQMHIIRRNVKVINTDGAKKEVEQITTNINGARKTNHTVAYDQNQVRENRQDNSSYGNRSQYNRPRYPANRVANVVITRNGKPVVNEDKNEVSNVEKIQSPIVDGVVTQNVVDKQNIAPNQNTNERRFPQNSNGYRPNNNNSTYQGNGGYRPNNGYRPNPDGANQGGYRPNNGYRPNPDGANQGGYRPNNGYRPNPDGTNQGGYRPNNGYRPNPDSANQGGYRPNNNSYQGNSGYRPNNGYRSNNSANNGANNSAYQVDKFMKQTAVLPIEQKETRDYTNIEKKKFTTEKVVDKKEKLDKNKLREQNSRVATSKLKGLEVNTSGNMLDLYERESDNFRKSARRKNQRQRPVLNQTKIIPMTEVKLPDSMTVKEFSESLKKQSSEIIKKLFGLGIMATVNQELDFDTAYLIAAEFGINAEKQVVVTEEDILFDESEDDEKDLKPRPPIVVVMGHVDHGKTSLLDRLRNESVASGESGGITQHIGAYKIKVKNREVCFLDTPGHEAFTAMRARGAQVTDIAIIVVAADDGIKPQTIEAIDHAKAAGVTIVVAINKIDKSTANIEKVKQELLEVGLVAEEWGGDTICVPISALTGEGIDNLLEMLLLVADMKNLKANPNKQSKGTVLEARLDKTKGTIVSMLVQRGTLNVGDTIVVGDMTAKVRAMKDDKGKKVKSAGPSTPVEVLGLSHVPQTGDIFYEVENDKVAKHLVERRKAKVRADLIRKGSKVTLDDLFGQIKAGKIKDLNIIIKADVQGSVEAIKESLEKLSNDEVRVRILHSSTGGIKESDVTLASVSNAIIIGFNVRPEALARQQADKEKVDMRLYSVIYDAINDVEIALKGMMPKKYQENVLGSAEVRRVFKITNVGIVAGCYVKSGKIIRNAMVRLVRDSIVLLEIKIDSLKREKEDAKEVAEGYECGIKLEKFSDIKEGDIFECFEMIEIK
ncbi:MAG: translation initiation factor IF-2 [Clostridia bacterium]